MTPRQRRIVYALAYEAIAVAFVGPALAMLFDRPAVSSTALAVVMSLVALVWSYLFNAWFERREARRSDRRRSFVRRVAHGVGFEGGLVVLLVPLMAWWLRTTLLQALVADLAVLGFFMIYAIVFTWAFDRVLGPPQSLHRSQQ